MSSENAVCVHLNSLNIGVCTGIGVGDLLEQSFSILSNSN